jgi:hypothetical protein
MAGEDSPAIRLSASVLLPAFLIAQFSSAQFAAALLLAGS